MQNKNLKLKLGLCGLVLTSFLALNAHSVVHADTVQNNNANAITWDSDSDDSQVVKEEPEQEKVSQSVQKQVPVQFHVQARRTQPVQNKKVMVSSVSSASSSQSVQNCAEKSIVRQSNFETSTVNRLNVNKSQANIKVSNVQDVAQASIQKQKVAQFNRGSKIYTLNGSNQLSKNNGDGYVITNAGIYDGRAVDIGVTINNVQDNQGTYTTKWSNGDKATQTGRTDANFKYQDSVLLNQQAVPVTVNGSRQRPVNVQSTQKMNVDHTWAWYGGGLKSEYDGGQGFIDPKLLSDTVTAGLSEGHAVQLLTQVLYEHIQDPNNKAAYATGASDFAYKLTHNIHDTAFNPDNLRVIYEHDSADGSSFNRLFQVPFASPSSWDAGTSKYMYNAPTAYNEDSVFDYLHMDSAFSANDLKKAIAGNPTNGAYNYLKQHVIWTRLPDVDCNKMAQAGDFEITPDKTWQETTTENVTDNVQVDQSTPASLGYNYTVGLYDAQTGELITDLKAEYNSKAGVQATAKDSVMNNAIKSKIQQINQNKAQVSYTGTRANDDVAFYKETRAVNPQDQSLHKSATRIISVNLPDDPAAKDRYKGVLNANNQIVQTINFTRTGVENIVSGQVTYGAWTGPSSFSEVTLPDIPGYTMTMS